MAANETTANDEADDDEADDGEAEDGEADEDDTDEDEADEDEADEDDSDDGDASTADPRRDPADCPEACPGPIAARRADAAGRPNEDPSPAAGFGSPLAWTSLEEDCLS